MKDGGNGLINGLFEAKLLDKQKSGVRPDSHTGLDERSKFIYDKYEHRKWYCEDAYKKLKIREQADMAINMQKAKATNCDMEEDFFAARTAKKSNPRGERFAAKSNDENEWWKDTKTKDHKQNSLQPGGSQAPSKSLNFLGDRRNLLSNLQMESKSRLMSDLTGLGIDSEKGTLPSHIKKKVSRSSRKEKSSGRSPVPQEDRLKPSSSSARTTQVRKPPNRSRSATSSSSGGESSSSGNNKMVTSQLIRKSAPPRSASGPVFKVSEEIIELQQNDQSMKNRNPRSGRDLSRGDSFDDSSRKKSGRHRSRSSSVKRSRAAARKNRTLVASLYDGSLADSIATGLATVDSKDDTSAVRGSRRRRGDEESQTSTRRGDERSVAPHTSGKSIPRDEGSHSTGRKLSCSRKVRSPTRRKGVSNGSVSRTPSPDLTHDSRRRVLPTDNPPRTPTKGAPIQIKRVLKDLRSRSHSRASRSPMRS
jgi:hypothetical protein